jgi:hypothetical protein
LIIAGFHDSDDLKRVLALRQLHALANGILVRPKLRSHGVVDDSDTRRGIAIILGEIASGDERNTEGREVVKIDGIDHGRDGF